MALESLFRPFQLGPVTLPNRLVMAPMTRGRAEADGTPNDLMAEYYVQRAAAGLLITEATPIAKHGVGWLGAPAMYQERHVVAWRKVTEAVHRAGSRIFLQLWHMGRVSHPDFLDGALPVGPSAIAAKGETQTPRGKREYVTPRPLETKEITAIVRNFADGARRARDAGFDGVEIHGANGYLIDQFLRDGSNQRNDLYGGSVENRVRFLTEVAEAVTRAWSPDRVGMRLSPRNPYNDMHDGDPIRTFSLAAERLGRLRLAYLHCVEHVPGHRLAVDGERVSPHMRRAFGGTFVVNGGYDAATAAGVLEREEADLVSFGLPFLANPDFVERVRTGAKLNAPDFATLYTPGPKGYTDYPTL